MTGQVWGLGESLVTDIASVWLLPGVDQPVPRHVSGQCKCLVAHITVERSLSCVKKLVLPRFILALASLAHL